VQGDNWNELLKEVITFDSVEEFWGIYVSAPELHLALLARRSLTND
jgi:translation initiation factor 4E